MPRYAITMRRLEAEYGITVDDLVERRIIGAVTAERVKAGKCRALRASTVNAVCDLAGCEPEVFFERVLEGQ